MSPEHTVKENSIVIPVHYSGETVKEMKKKIMEYITQLKGKEIYLDFSDTQFIDSSAIGSLISIAKEANQEDTTLILRGLNEEIMQLFDYTGLDHIFTIERKTILEVGEKEFFKEPNDVMLDIRKEIIDDICIFNMSGTMSHPVGARYFKQIFLFVLADYKKILLDMEELSFIDSMSLSTILSLNRLLINTDGSMRICRTNSIIEEIFHLLKIETIIPMFSSRKEALSNWE